MAASVRNGRTGNLPAEPNTFIGRKSELAEISALLGTARLVTLTGPGGVGKSRLALRAAHAVRAAFPGGVWLVELSDLKNPDLLTNALAEATRLTEQTLRPLLEAVYEHLDDGPLLLLLDTCDHVLDECARVVQELLAHVPELRVLATSRQPLGVAGEHLLSVTPLPLGERDDAVALFAARAAAAVPSFALTDANRAGVAAVCARLDGIPLALELAAVRLRGFALDRLLAGLDSRFDLLVSPARPRLARHQTLRTAIGWSHELCTPLERLLWARLSVFAGGWDVEAAEFVCHGGPLDAEEILALLASLTEKSIVTREGDGVAGRYRMLDTVRTFGAEWLEGLGEQDAVRVRHRDYFRWIARQGQAEWLGPGQRMWAERLSVEHANLRVALEECLMAPEPESALELAGTLWYFWFACGFAEEGRGHLERALRRAHDGGPEHTLATWAHRLVTVVPDDLDAAESVSAAYVWLAEERQLPVPALPLTGASLAVRGESARSALLYGSSAQGPGGGGGAEFFQLLTLALQAYLLAGQGAFERCAAVAERLRADCAKRGELWMRAWGDFFVALAGIGLGRPDDALVSARQALAAKWRVHDRLGAAAVADLLVAAEASRGEPERAARLLGAGTRLWHAAGLPQLGDSGTTVFRREYARHLRKALGDTVFAEAVSEGRELSPEAAIRLALDGVLDEPDL
ncbi:AAA family ATPase [Streptomyces phaeochromogenes]|uniref:ATP-binding protein n=1 Tax=Streptomyces phaeochromogenes TaxID=1923 RepID=UPI00386CA274|nr:AAA family ATPase [Streptomyces phaeochromogenes]WTA08859.1 AAA family ATPase [Streptomyces phaeochromogenes]